MQRFILCSNEIIGNKNTFSILEVSHNTHFNVKKFIVKEAPTYLQFNTLYSVYISWVDRCR